MDYKEMLASRFSETTDNTLEDPMHTKNPYFTIKVIEAKNLNYLTDTSSLQPFVVLKLADRSYSTNVNSDEEHPYWGEEFEIEVDKFEPLLVRIYDRDDYGSDTVLTSFYFHSNLFDEWKGRIEDLWVKLSPISDSISSDSEAEDFAYPYTEDMLAFEDEDSPMIHLQIGFMDAETLGRMKVTAGSYKTVVRGRDAYTLYEFIVSRNDGCQWAIELRYSQVRDLRNELLLGMPELSRFPFPSRTYTDWLSFLCMRCSRFDASVIQHRKQQLENFLNHVLDMSPKLHSDKLIRLLRIP